MTRRPTRSTYELNRCLARRARRRATCLEEMKNWRFGQLLDCIHWRDKALNRADLAIGYNPFIWAGILMAFGLAAIALVASAAIALVATIGS